MARYPFCFTLERAWFTEIICRNKSKRSILNNTVTLKEIADELGVSRMTVSRVLSGKSRGHGQRPVTLHSSTTAIGRKMQKSPVNSSRFSRKITVPPSAASRKCDTITAIPEIPPAARCAGSRNNANPAAYSVHPNVMTI